MLQEIVIGTSNPAKVAQIRGALRGLDLKVSSISDYGVSLDVVEDGKTAQENAKKKSVAYAQALGRPVLSMDNALYLDPLKPEEQPGIHVRRIGSTTDRPTDQDLLDYYSNLIRRLGDRVNGRWEFAVAIADSNGQVEETTIISPRIFVSKVSEVNIPGYPLESLQIDPESGKYISEMTQEEQDEFWQKMIGVQLSNFVSKYISK